MTADSGLPGRHPSAAVVAKAMTLLTSGAVRMTYADDMMCTAKVRAERRVRPYEVTYVPVLCQWHCECAGSTLGGVTCSHMLAVAAVWSPPPVLRAV